MVLKETKRHLRNLNNAYGNLLQSAKKDLRPYGHDACEYRGIEEKDKDFVYGAICNLSSYVNDSNGAIYFDVRNVFVTEKNALRALTDLHAEIWKDGSKLKELMNKYLKREGVDYYALKHCLRYYWKIYNLLSEILDSKEVKEFLESGHNTVAENANESVVKISLSKKYQSCGKELFRLLQEEFITGGTVDDFMAMFNGKKGKQVRWNEKKGGYREIVFMLTLLWVFTFDNHKQFHARDNASKTIDKLLHYFYIEGKEYPKSIDVMVSTFANYINGTRVNFGKGADNIPKSNSTLIEIFKKAFSVNYPIPFGGK